MIGEVDRVSYALHVGEATARRVAESGDRDTESKRPDVNRRSSLGKRGGRGGMLLSTSNKRQVACVI